MFSQFLLNLDCESICDPPGSDTLSSSQVSNSKNIKLRVIRCFKIFSHLFISSNIAFFMLYSCSSVINVIKFDCRGTLSP